MLNRFSTITCIVAPIAAAFMMFATAECALASNASHNGAGGMTGVSHIPSIQTTSPTATSANAFHLAARQIAPSIQSSPATRIIKSDARIATSRSISRTPVSSPDTTKAASASSKPATSIAAVEDSHTVTPNTAKPAVTASVAAASSTTTSSGVVANIKKRATCVPGPTRDVGCTPPPTHVFDFSYFAPLGHDIATGGRGVAHAAVWFYNGNMKDFSDWGHLIGQGADEAGSAAKSVYHFFGGLF